MIFFSCSSFFLLNSLGFFNFSEYQTLIPIISFPCQYEPNVTIFLFTRVRSSCYIYIQIYYYVGVAVANINVLISFVCFDSALYSNYFGLVKKFHAEQVFHIDFLEFLCGFGYFVPCRIIIIARLLNTILVNLPISSFVEALEK